MKVLVTGGGGFLGGLIVRKLVGRGDAVAALSRTATDWHASLGVSHVAADLTDTAAVARAAAGCDAVIHVAAKAGVWGPFAEFHRVNVSGTQSVLEACRRAGVPRLVYTSTPSVVHGGASLDGVTEAAPYPAHFDAPYPATKALAEQAVLAADGPTLSTVALRPHLIWGPGDPHLIPRVLAKARAGKLRRIGSRPVIVDVTYVENAADAHLLALDRLAPGAACAGRAYFITNGEPVELWDFLNRVLAIHGLPPVTRTVPVWAAKLAGAALETAYRLSGRTAEPPLTRFVAGQLSTSHWYDIAAARRDLGYAPAVSVEEGLRRLAAADAGDSATRTTN